MKLAKLNSKPEIFYTLQGEGKNIGVPSVFVRLSLCNLNCRYCDTDYTWDWDKYDQSNQITTLNAGEIMAEILKYKCHNVVLTGGEPMIQHKGLLELMKLEPSFHYEIETNGTIKPGSDFNKLISQYNVSPKLANSGVIRSEREKTGALLEFSVNPKAIFKFVIDTPEDIEEVEDLIAKYVISRSRVYLMPQATTEQELRNKSSWLAEECKNYGYNFTTRLQVILWGRQRGV